jgi:polyphenol oxidase
MRDDDVPPSCQSSALASVQHGFFGRDGGVSSGIYANLNSGPGSRDDPASVAENRRRIAAAFALQPTHLIGAHQVHSPDAVFVREPWPGARPHADALVTTAPGLALSIVTADCAPVLLADRDAGVIGAAHAGWKGALSGVLEACVALMHAHGAQRIVAAIGPCIHQQSYEVGPEFVARFVESDAAHVRFFRAGAGEKSHFDLPGFCASRLAALDIETDILPLDTYALAARFHSHRRSVHERLGDYGRNCAAIML